MSILRSTFADELKRVLRERNLTVTSASRTLGISRQALYNYLNEVATPRARILAKAMEVWGLEIQVGQAKFDRSSFAANGTNSPVLMSKPPKQLDLWAHLDAIKEEDLHIAVKRVGKSLRVSVQIEIPA